VKGWLALAAVVALVAWDSWRGDLPPGAESPGSAPRIELATDREAAASSRRPARDLFRYDLEPGELERWPTPDPGEEPEEVSATPEPAPRVRLVGFIRQGSELRAALSVLGRISLLGEGEAVEGFELVALEEDVGVRVRSPDGVEQELRLPPR